MSTDFDVAAVISTAVAVEEKGAHFYARMADKTADLKAKEMFTKLAAEEREHRRIFEKMQHGLPLKKSLEKNTVAFLKALFATNPFPADHQAGAETAQEALVIGIQAEKDSILLYQELYDQTDSPEVKQTISKLLREEKLHLVELRDYLEELG